MINFNIPNFSKEIYISYWAKLNKVVNVNNGLIMKDFESAFSTMDYGDMAKFLNTSVTKCKAFIKEAGEKGIMIITSYDTNGKIRYDFCFTEDYIIKEI
jgi:hypothetical protein